MSLTAKDIEEITRLLENSSFDELDLEIGGMKIHLRRGGAARSGAGEGFPGLERAPANSRSELEWATTSATSNPGNPSPAPLTAVRAPLLGTFYRAPKPGAPPFVEVGTLVEPDTIVGIIEVMKLMNTVRAGVRGVVTEILARDGLLVEFDEVLLSIDERQAG